MTFSLSFGFTTPGLVATLNPKNKVDLTKPKLTIIIEVIKAVCCIGVVEDYSLYKKYNLQEVMKDDAPTPTAPAAPTESEAAEQVEATEKEEKDGENAVSGNMAEDDKPIEDRCDADQ